MHLGDDEYVLCQGDTMHFEIKSPYTFSNSGLVTCAYYVIIIRKQAG